MSMSIKIKRGSLDDLESGEKVLAAGPKRSKQQSHVHDIALRHLPQGRRYTKSFMHLETISFVNTTLNTNFVITASMDGHVKFWKSQAQGVEFVKDFKAHVSSILSTATTNDGSLYVSIAIDKTAKVFDVASFDLMSILDLGFTPRSVCWISSQEASQNLLAISDENTPNTYIYDLRQDSAILINSSTHKSPVVGMTYSSKYNCIISADKSGMVEYWMPSEGFLRPKGTFDLKSLTDLYDFKKTKSIPCCITISPDQERFATYSLPDRVVRIFCVKKGTIERKYNESIDILLTQHAKAEETDPLDFSRRIGIEKELEREKGIRSSANVIFDASSNFICYGSLEGIKIINMETNACERVLGKEDNIRPICVALLHGVPAYKSPYSLAAVASSNPLLSKQSEKESRIFCTAFRKNRFFIYEKELDASASIHERDVHNERAAHVGSVEEKTHNATFSGTSGIIHTSLGDIHIELFPSVAPKAVENFVTHSKNGYYNSTIFHRIIKKFMIQGGDPLGDGTGGESIWQAPFEDEISTYKHDRPFILSMANAGPNTNGSQFFITTEKAPWLDGKHTIFGAAKSGLDVIFDIENLSVDRFDKPENPPRIINISICM